MDRRTLAGAGPGQRGWRVPRCSTRRRRTRCSASSSRTPPCRACRTSTRCAPTASSWPTPARTSRRAWAAWPRPGRQPDLRRLTDRGQRRLPGQRRQVAAARAALALHRLRHLQARRAMGLHRGGALQRPAVLQPRQQRRERRRLLRRRQVLHRRPARALPDRQAVVGRLRHRQRQQRAVLELPPLPAAHLHGRAALRPLRPRSPPRNPNDPPYAPPSRASHSSRCSPAPPPAPTSPCRSGGATAGSDYEAAFRVGHALQGRPGHHRHHGASPERLSPERGAGPQGLDAGQQPAPRCAWKAELARDRAAAGQRARRSSSCAASSPTSRPAVLQGAADLRQGQRRLGAIAQRRCRQAGLPAARLDVLAPGVAAVDVRDAWVRVPRCRGRAVPAPSTKLNAPSGARLVGVSTPAAGIAEVHEMKMEGDTMRMREVKAPDAAGAPDGRAQAQRLPRDADGPEAAPAQGCDLCR